MTGLDERIQVTMTVGDACKVLSSVMARSARTLTIARSRVSTSNRPGNYSVYNDMVQSLKMALQDAEACFPIAIQVSDSWVTRLDHLTESINKLYASPWFADFERELDEMRGLTEDGPEVTNA